MDRLLRASLAALAAAAPACGGAETPRPARPNVLIVSIDTLRADHLGCYGYAPGPEPVSPRIDQFAKEALVFERCFAPRGQTGPSLASMLTGCYPSRHGVLDNFQRLRPEAGTIAHHLAAAGYATHAFLSFLPIHRSSKLALGFTPPRAETVEGGGAVERRDGSFFEAKRLLPEGPQSRWDDAAERELVRFLRARCGDAPPFFAWVHFYDVHQPYAAPPLFTEKFAGGYRGPLRLGERASEAAFDQLVKKHLDERMRARAALDEADRLYVIGLYDGGVAAVDQRFGRLLDALDQAGVAGETIVVLTADHGEELGEHNHFWFHGNSVYDPVLRIPLLVRGPGVSAGRYGELSQNVDLLPTLLDFLGEPVPAGIDGISFAAELRGARTDAYRRRIAWSEWQHLILAARTDRWKLVLNPRGARPKKPPFHAPDDPGYFVDCRELYEISADPRETKNLWREQKGAVEELRREVEQEFARRFAGLDPSAGEAIDDPQEAARLEKLGYTTGGAADYALDPQSCKDE